MRNEINCIVCEVEHKVGNYLDVVYLEKKFTVSEVYENIMAA